MSSDSEQIWQVHDRFLELHSRWMTLIGEHLQDHQGEILAYWRIEKADSVIVLPIQDGQILLPPPSYRPGVGQVTLDFPGGRVSEGQTLAQAAIATLKRELGIEAANITQLIPLNTQGWAVNSSFSNQKLYGFVAHIDNTKLRSELVAVTYSVTLAEVQDLLQNLTCVQCRAVFLEWWLNFKYSNFQ
ncbi:NUDIX domain-containing protein [Phormidesmis priestleyi ULC007]|uniref:NUDIX domain-containing protein n=1 Tax=Phormidesmis priestleyi ULC007 TaxID=1920490 RepID=A0A2T1D9V0_9CYAN|nr:NUDIX domain-containing protein [Phormidesmis priestleyi]PSB17289.1 NUDIX domain-containing protein [Phormidesmis priestleyi ULC007]PZO48080.1 MAG: NUDIX domain-containing protein [Phormidesmis priestleyi]